METQATMVKAIDKEAATQKLKEIQPMTRTHKSQAAALQQSSKKKQKKDMIRINTNSNILIKSIRQQSMRASTDMRLQARPTTVKKNHPAKQNTKQPPLTIIKVVTHRPLPINSTEGLTTRLEILAIVG